MLDVQTVPTTLDALRFTNRFTQTLPADPSTVNRPRQVMGASFSRVAPKGMKAPHLIAYSREVAELLDLSPADVQSDAFRQVFVGNRLPFKYHLALFCF